MKVGIIVGIVIVIAVLSICLRPITPSNYIYENGGILVGADGEPIELINNPPASATITITIYTGNGD